MIQQVLVDYWVFHLIGASFILTGWIMPRRKWYWLIAGVNSMEPELLRRYDLRLIERVFGRLLVILGTLILLNPWAMTLLGRRQWTPAMFMVIVLGSVCAWFVHGALRRDRFYQKDLPQQ
ncbi:MAG: DUF3784 domain-containing protein [Cyclobacteriaceae bacterium]|nr:DUF3784 domain-containing protein [Cyclobacteriaceae bacterium]